MAISKVKVWNPNTGKEEEVEVPLDLPGNKPSYIEYVYQDKDSNTLWELKYECYPAVPFLSTDTPLWRIKMTRNIIQKTTGRIMSTIVCFPNGSTAYGFSADNISEYTYWNAPYNDN